MPDLPIPDLPIPDLPIPDLPIPDLQSAIKVIVHVVELGGVLIIIIGLGLSTIRFLLFRDGPEKSAYQQYRKDLGRSIVLGLEVLVAGDIISTVAIAPSLNAALSLAVIVLIRTFLSISIEVEINGRLPWQNRKTEKSD